MAACGRRARPRRGGERTAGDRQADQDHRVCELLIVVVDGIRPRDQVADGGRRVDAGIRGCVLEHGPGLFDRWHGAVRRHVDGVHAEAGQPCGRNGRGWPGDPAGVHAGQGAAGNAAPGNREWLVTQPAPSRRTACPRTPMLRVPGRRSAANPQGMPDKAGTPHHPTFEVRASALVGATKVAQAAVQPTSEGSRLSGISAMAVPRSPSLSRNGAR
jgi:hypothetical protein